MLKDNWTSILNSSSENPIYIFLFIFHTDFFKSMIKSIFYYGVRIIIKKLMYQRYKINTLPNPGSLCSPAILFIKPPKTNHFFLQLSTYFMIQMTLKQFTFLYFICIITETFENTFFLKGHLCNILKQVKYI